MKIFKCWIATMLMISMIVTFDVSAEDTNEPGKSPKPIPPGMSSQNLNKAANLIQNVIDNKNIFKEYNCRRKNKDTDGYLMDDFVFQTQYYPWGSYPPSF